MFNLPLYLFIVSTFFSACIAQEEEERAFIAVYGKNNETSGVWQAVRDISSDEEKMRTLCQRAHSQTKSPATDVIDHIKFEKQPLTFIRRENASWDHQSILVDMVAYNVTRQPPFELPKNYFFYFTKGTKLDCIFYLIKWRRSKKPLFRIGLPFCDVKVPK